jgi:hypothetical protein
MGLRIWSDWPPLFQPSLQKGFQLVVALPGG